MNQWEKKSAVMRRYDATAQIYDIRYEAEQKTKMKAALKHMKVRSSDIALDVGCGTGLFFSHISDKVAATVGIDISRKNLKIAKQRSRTSSNVLLVLADADDMPFPPDTFDLSFAFTVIQNAPKPARMVQEIRRVTKQRGQIVVTALKKVIDPATFEQILTLGGLKPNLVCSDNMPCGVAICTAVTR